MSDPILGCIKTKTYMFAGTADTSIGANPGIFGSYSSKRPHHTLFGDVRYLATREWSPKNNGINEVDLILVWQVDDLLIPRHDVFVSANGIVYPLRAVQPYSGYWEWRMSEYPGGGPQVPFVNGGTYRIDIY